MRSCRATCQSRSAPPYGKGRSRVWIRPRTWQAWPKAWQARRQASLHGPKDACEGDSDRRANNEQMSNGPWFGRVTISTRGWLAHFLLALCRTLGRTWAAVNLLLGRLAQTGGFAVERLLLLAAGSCRKTGDGAGVCVCTCN